jgi:hypothetical protein
MQAISAILTLLLLTVAGFYTHALIRPRHSIYRKHFGESVTRGLLSKKFLPALAIIFVLIGITAPPSQADQKQLQAPPVQTTQQPTSVTKEVSDHTSIPYETQTTDDPLLPKGQTSVAQEGTDGEKTTVYEVTYLDGKETNRVVKSESTTKQPIPRIIHNGTYVAPTVTSPSTQSGGGYTNVDGNHVASPSPNPSGATAQCRDGSYSYSQHRSGTCSHHGGVATWF